MRVRNCGKPAGNVEKVIAIQTDIVMPPTSACRTKYKGSDSQFISKLPNEVARSS